MDYTKELPSKTDKEIKEIVKDVYDGKILTSLDVPEYLVRSVFMPLMLLGPVEPEKPKRPEVSDTTTLRDREIYIISEEENLIDQYNKDVEKYKKDCKKFNKNFVPSLGMVYSNLDTDQLPRGINGYPMFTKIGLLNKEDSNKFVDYMNSYIKLRKELDEGF